MCFRQRRVSIDLVHDDVERELMKEREVIEGVASLLNRTLEQTNEQIRCVRGGSGSSHTHDQVSLSPSFSVLAPD